MPSPRGPRPVALAYHGVGAPADGEDPNRLVVTPRRLEAQVRLLQRLGYRFRTAAEVLEQGGGAPPARGTAVLTFDDGWRDAVTTTAPLLRRLGVRATFYVCPALLGRRHADVRGEAGRLMDAGEVAELDALGMDVASHTLTHPDLRTLDDAGLERELRGSRAALEDLLGRPVRTLAYPFGLFDERVRTAAGAAGYGLAWAWMPGPWSPLAAPRLPGPPRHGAGRLALKLLGVRRRTP
jgi:peptidoglycan/xylan/chitin deacetylase (PgdA/CDA1 family)